MNERKECSLCIFALVDVVECSGNCDAGMGLLTLLHSVDMGGSVFLILIRVLDELRVVVVVAVVVFDYKCICAL